MELWSSKSYIEAVKKIFFLTAYKVLVYLYNATPRRTAKMPVANAKNNAINTWESAIGINQKIFFSIK